MKIFLYALIVFLCSCNSKSFEPKGTDKEVDEVVISVHDVVEEIELSEDYDIVENVNWFTLNVYENEVYLEENKNKVAFLENIPDDYIAINSFEEFQQYKPDGNIEIYVKNELIDLYEYFDKEYFDNKSLIIYHWEPNKDRGTIESIELKGNDLEILKIKKVEKYVGSEPYIVYSYGCEFIEVDKHIENVYIKHKTVIKTVPWLE